MTPPGKYPELDKLEAMLNKEISHLQRQRTINMTIGLVLAAIILAYFGFMSMKVKEMLEPKEVAGIAASRLVSYMPEARANLEESARKEVPLLVDGMIDKLLNDSLPQAHAGVKSLVLETADKAIDDAENIFFSQITEHLKTHGAALRSLSDDLSTDEGTQAFEDAVFATLEEVAQDPGVQADLLGYGAALEHLAGTLEYLAQNDISLTPEEESLRELISVFRELMNRARSAS